MRLARRQEAITWALDLAGCYVVTTDVARADLSARQVDDSYVSLRKVERNFRTLKTGLLEVRPVWVRKESRRRVHVLNDTLEPVLRSWYANFRPSIAA